MKRCLIFCAARCDGLLEPVVPDDYILAADGGLRHLERLGLTPDGIIGDFDSLGYTPSGAAVFPIEKDDTDAMLAVRAGLERGYRHFLLYGALDGPRLDHTVANFQTLQFLCDQGAEGYLIGEQLLVTAVKNGSLEFDPGATGVVSVFCMGAPAKGVTLTGLKYPLNNAVLTAGFPLGVSNHFTGSAATVTVEDGSLLVIYDRANGLARRR